MAKVLRCNHVSSKTGVHDAKEPSQPGLGSNPRTVPRTFGGDGESQVNGVSRVDSLLAVDSKTECIPNMIDDPI